jgi:hypothetical protein
MLVDVHPRLINTETGPLWIPLRLSILTLVQALEMSTNQGEFLVFARFEVCQQLCCIRGSRVQMANQFRLSYVAAEAVCIDGITAALAQRLEVEQFGRGYVLENAEENFWWEMGQWRRRRERLLTTPGRIEKSSIP